MAARTRTLGVDRDYKTLYDFMYLEYFPVLKDGITLAGEMCPQCDGGTNKEKSLSVTKRGNQLLWLCHRASCDFRRGKNYDGAEYITQPKPAEGARLVTYPHTTQLNSLDFHTLNQRYSIDKLTAMRAGIEKTSKGDIFGVGDEPYYLFMITNALSEVVGYCAKAMVRGCNPKNKMATKFPSAIAWYPNRTKTSSILVVEDVLSAIRTSKRMTGVSILGTVLNERKIEEMLSTNPNNIYLALDKDAFDKAAKYVVEFRAKTNGRLRLVHISKDVKDMTEEQFNKLMDSLP